MKHSIRVMNSQGDTRITWDTEDPVSLEEAREVFERAKLRGQVFRAQPNGEGGGVMKAFDPQADMIAVPAIVAG